MYIYKSVPEWFYDKITNGIAVGNLGDKITNLLNTKFNLENKNVEILLLLENIKSNVIRFYNLVFYTFFWYWILDSI